jgi:signal transduction histidine kinase
MHRCRDCWDSDHVGNTWVVWLVAAVVGWLVALAAVAGQSRSRRAFRTALEERGWLLERERETAAQLAVDAERARIARELHDIVSHTVSLMVIQAGAARQVLATEPASAAEAMLAVEAAGRDAMTELRHLLGVLSPTAEGDLAVEDGGTAAPQPSLSRLTPLIDRVAFAGLPVDVRISGEPRPLPSGVDVTAYRIIQEALTNALKHGDGVRAEVTVRYAERYLRIEVLNSGPSVLQGDPAPRDQVGGDSPGRGLVGLRERVAVYGGELDARRRLGGGYRVRARIPLARP